MKNNEQEANWEDVYKFSNYYLELIPVRSILLEKIFVKEEKNNVKNGNFNNKPTN